MKLTYKRIALSALLMVFRLIAIAQSANANYVKTEIFTTPSGSNNCINIDYFDKKGRLSQNLNNGSGNGNYVRTYYEYNNSGMLNRQSSLIDSQNDCSYKTSYNLTQESRDSYDEDEFAYTTLSYDGLGNLSSILGPGFDWYDDERSVNYDFLLNKANTIKHYTISEQDGILIDKGEFYEKDKLKCQKRRDENGHVKEVYFDELGRKVLERGIGEENHDTYYVYDKLNRLRYVLTPQYQKTPDVSLYTYQYSYDERNRIVSKILPGGIKTLFGYNSSDKLVIMQDAMLCTRSLYRVFMYDALGRLCIQGTCSQDIHINGDNVIKYDSHSSGIAQTGYVCQEPCEFQDFELEEVRYYDNYDFLASSLFQNVGISGKLNSKEQVSDGNMTITENITAQTKGLLTGQLQVCSSGEKLYHAHYYDHRGRLAESVGSYGADKSLLIAYDLNYTGLPERSLSILNYRGTTHTFASKNSYHSATGKRIESKLSIDGQPYQVTSKPVYDKLGRLVSHIQGNASTNYKYNTRGWLRNIKSPGLDEELMYTYYEMNEGNDFFNGNLATAEFTLPNSKEKHHVEYNYDELDRLTECIYYTNDNGVIVQDWKYGVKIPSYDLNGNINQLKRQGKKDDGTFGLVDNLTLKYTGNQLKSVSDYAEDVCHKGSTDFKDGYNFDVEYVYDANGAMTNDKNKGIELFEYDQLNFPKRIRMKNSHQVEYCYTPNGGKLRVVHHLQSPVPFVPSGLQLTESASQYTVTSDTTEYLGNFILRNGVVDKVLFNGGFASLNEGIAHYHYFTQDQQGSVRAVFDEKGKVEQYLTYDALGNIIPDLSSNVDFQPYAFNGKELDKTFGLNLHDFGFRNYDSTLGRWTSMDRKSEDYASTTPYAFCLNNFANGKDPFGLDYWSTSDPDAIRRFMEGINEGNPPADYYKDFELHTKDADFLSNLTYNDEKEEYYVNFGRIEKGEATCVGLTFRAGMALVGNAFQTIKTLQNINVGLFGTGSSISLQNELFDVATAMQTDNSYMRMHTKSYNELTNLNLKAFGSGTTKFINASKIAGKVLGWGGVSISAVDAFEYLYHGGTNMNIYAKDFADFAMGILSITGGPIGFSIGIAYTLSMMYLESSGNINLERTY